MDIIPEIDLISVIGLEEYKKDREIERKHFETGEFELPPIEDPKISDLDKIITHENTILKKDFFLKNQNLLSTRKRTNTPIEDDIPVLVEKTKKEKKVKMSREVCCFYHIAYEESDED